MSASDIPIIVTRAEPGASETLLRLEQLGYTVLRAPALALHEQLNTPLPTASAISGLVFTSANGVRAYATQRDDRESTTWCVGPATAEAARQAGFGTIHESVGNASDLAHFIAANSAPEDEPLLHVANAAAAGNLKRELEALGFSVAFAPLYAMHPSSVLPNAVLDLIDKNTPAIVLIHSAKGAEAFANMLGRQNMQVAALVAISESASAPLAKLALDRTYVAAVPNEDGLLRALKRAVATLSA